MTKKLNAAEPTIVAAPSSPGRWPSVINVSYILSTISGALDPKAMRVKFAKVGFQMSFFLKILVPSGISVITFRVWEVITSIESINTSEIRAIPTKK